MHDIWLYWDVYDKVFYEPRRSNKRVHGIGIPRVDLVRIRLAVTFGKASIASSTGIPDSSYRYNLSSYTSAVFGLKTPVQYNDEDDLTYSTAGFDTGDTDWHQAATCCLTLTGVVVPLSVDSGRYLSEITLLKTGQSWRLAPFDDPLPCDVFRDVYTGSESNAPSGLPGGTYGPWSISGSNSSTTITNAAFTGSSRLAVGVLSPTGSPGGVIIVQTPSTGQVILASSDASAPGTSNAWNGNWTLL